MAPLLIVGLYALEFWGLSLAKEHGVDLPAKTALAIIALVLPIVVYSIIDRALVYRAAERIGRDWCASHGEAYLRVLHYKSHFSIVYKHGGKTGRQKFSLAFVPTTWKIERIHWL